MEYILELTIYMFLVIWKCLHECPWPAFGHRGWGWWGDGTSYSYTSVRYHETPLPQSAIRSHRAGSGQATPIPQSGEMKPNFMKVPCPSKVLWNSQISIRFFETLIPSLGTMKHPFLYHERSNLVSQIRYYKIAIPKWGTRKLQYLNQ